MNPRYDDLGPRIDIGHEPPGAAPAASHPARPYAPPKSRGGMGVFGVIALLLSLLALALALWSLMRTPEQMPIPNPSPGVVPGATAERTAKLEKDVGDLMLRLVTLEKELEAVRAKAGSVEAFLHPGERPIDSASPIESIRVAYPAHEIGILGWEAHWLVPFLISSVAAAFLTKGFFRVQL